MKLWPHTHLQHGESGQKRPRKAPPAPIWPAQKTRCWHQKALCFEALAYYLGAIRPSPSPPHTRLDT